MVRWLCVCTIAIGCGPVAEVPLEQSFADPDEGCMLPRGGPFCDEETLPIATVGAAHPGWDSDASTPWRPAVGEVSMLSVPSSWVGFVEAKLGCGGDTPPAITLSFSVEGGVLQRRSLRWPEGVSSPIWLRHPLDLRAGSSRPVRVQVDEVSAGACVLELRLRGVPLWDEDWLADAPRDSGAPLECDAGWCPFGIAPD